MAPATEIVALARSIADRHGLHETLACAVVEQESAWDSYAMRRGDDLDTHRLTQLVDLLVALSLAASDAPAA